MSEPKFRPTTMRLIAAFLMGALLPACGGDLQANEGSAGQDPKQNASGPSAEAGDTKARRLPVRVIRIGEPRIEKSKRTYTGILQARREVSVGVAVAGEVIEVPLAEGQAVAQGDLLVRLDDRRLLAAQQAAVAKKEAASARLDELKKGPRTESIDAARANVRSLESDRALAQSTLTRREQLLKTDSTTEEEVDRTRAQVTSLDARIAAAAAQLSELENGTRSEVLAMQEAELRGIEADLARIQIDLDDTRVTAPFAGRVQTILVREGAVVPAGMGAVQLIEADRLEAHFGLPQNAARNLEGARPEITSMGSPVAYESMRSLPLLDPVHRTERFIFEVRPDANARLLPGASVTMHLTHPLSEPGWRIPLTAVTEGVRGMWAGHLVTGDGQVQVVDLQMLNVEANHCVVTGALRPGDQLIADGVDRVIAGQRVTVQAEAGTPGETQTGAPQKASQGVAGD